MTAAMIHILLLLFHARTGIYGSAAVARPWIEIVSSVDTVIMTYASDARLVDFNRNLQIHIRML